MPDRDLELKIRALIEGAKDVDELKRSLKELSDQKVKDNTGNLRRGLGATSDMAQRLRGVLLGLGAAVSFTKIINNTIRQEQALAQVEQRIRSTGGAAGYTTQELADMAGELQKVSTYGDEAILDMQSVLMTFTQVRGDEFKDATSAILDMSKALDKDLKSSAIQVGKALNDPVKGVSALGDAGVQFSEQQRDLIKHLVETGDVAGAQRVILKELEVQFGGSAAAARDTLGGALESMSNAFGDLLEADSMGGATESLNRLTDFLSDPNTVAGANALTSALIDGFGLAAQAITRTVGGAQALGQLIARYVHGPDYVDGLREQFEGVSKAIRGTDAQIRLTQSEIGKLQDRVNAVPEGKARDHWQQMLEHRQAILNQLIEKRREQTERLEAINTQLGEALAPVIEDAPNEGRGASGGAPAGSGGTKTDPDPDAANRQKQIQAIIDKLQEQADTYGMTAEAAAVYRLQQLGADEDAIKHAESIGAKVRALQEEEKAQQAATREAEEAAREKKRNEEADAKLLEQLNEEIRLLGFRDRALAEEQALRRLSADATDAQREAVRKLAGDLYDLQEQAKESHGELTEFSIQAARNMQSAFADFLFDPFEDGLEGMAKGFAKTLQRMAAELASQMILREFFKGMAGMGAEGGGWANFFTQLSANVKHSGGIAGGAGATRNVSPALFLRAPRYHSGGIAGLAPDEVPAILRRGEEVLTESDPRHRGNGGLGGETRVIINNNSGAEAEVEHRSGPSGEDIIVTIEQRMAASVYRNGALGQAIGQTFGVQRKGAHR